MFLFLLSPSFSCCSVDLRSLLSFPTRRSSDLPRHPPFATLLRTFPRRASRCWSARCRPRCAARRIPARRPRSEEHTSELQSLRHLVCRLLLEKKKKTKCTRRPNAHHDTDKVRT